MSPQIIIRHPLRFLPTGSPQAAEPTCHIAATTYRLWRCKIAATHSSAYR